MHKNHNSKLHTLELLLFVDFHTWILIREFSTITVTWTFFKFGVKAPSGALVTFCDKALVCHCLVSLKSMLSFLTLIFINEYKKVYIYILYLLLFLFTVLFLNFNNSTWNGAYIGCKPWICQFIVLFTFYQCIIFCVIQTGLQIIIFSRE